MCPCPCLTSRTVLSSSSPLIIRYVYDHLGGNHVDAVKELVATLCTYGVTILWLGPCPAVLLWASLNCLGLNLELWTAKLFSMEPLASFEVCWFSRSVSGQTFARLYILSVTLFLETDAGHLGGGGTSCRVSVTCFGYCFVELFVQKRLPFVAVVFFLVRGLLKRPYYTTGCECD